MRRILCSVVLASCLPTLSLAQSGDYDRWVTPLRERGLSQMGAYRMLYDLTTNVGHRLSGSEGADRAVQWGKRTMEAFGFQNVRLQECMVPRWVRGPVEEAFLINPDGSETKLNVFALGGSMATPPEGITAEVIEVKSLDEAAQLGDRAKGKFVFFNGAMDPTLVNTFEAYGRAVGQRSGGAAATARVGGVGALVRSMTLDPDDEPHAGGMRYQDGVPKVPTAALSIVAANRLSEAIQKNGSARVRLKLTCESLPDVPSANVIGEIVGSERPNEIVLMGAHLDSWDKGTGAHDNGSGVVQCIEALRLIKELGWKPKRTIRVVLFMNEENGTRGSRAYLDAAKAAVGKEMQYASIESDAGGFAPRGFSVSYDEQAAQKLSKWLPALSTFGAERFRPNGRGGVDTGPLIELGTVLFGLMPEGQRYFDYHHSNKDTIDKVNPRELQLGALSMALLAWLLAGEGIPE